MRNYKGFSLMLAISLLSFGACSTVSPSVSADPTITGGENWSFKAKSVDTGVEETIKIYVLDSGAKTELGEMTLSMINHSGTFSKKYKGKDIQVNCRAVDEGGGSTNDSCMVYINGKAGPKLEL